MAITVDGFEDLMNLIPLVLVILLVLLRVRDENRILDHVLEQLDHDVRERLRLVDVLAVVGDYL